MVGRVLTLDRFLSCSHGVFGYLQSGATRFTRFVTCEEEQQGNKPRISCIPAGEYVCKRRFYNRGKYDTFEVTGVKGRSLILFHIANSEEDLEGCIGLGMSIGVIDRKDEDAKIVVPKLAVLQSSIAFKLFMASLSKDESFRLVVNDPKA
jgi:hypothetical protein